MTPIAPARGGPCEGAMARASPWRGNRAESPENSRENARENSLDRAPPGACPDRSDARYWGWEVGGGRITRQPGQVRKEEDVTRFRSGSLFHSPTRPTAAPPPTGTESCRT